MDLPHQKPIRFTQEVVCHDEESILVSVIFPYSPTLSMVSEAAAQSSAAFKQDDKTLIGFLISLKNVEQICEFTKVKYNIKIKKEISLGSMTEFSFELMDDNNICARGSLTILLQN